MANIGLDIDDVIFQTSNELKKIIISCNDEEITKHKLDIMRGEAVNKKVGDFLKTNVIPTIKAVKPMDDVVKFIKKIKKQSNKIILITARGDKFFPGSEEITFNSLKKYDIEYDDIIFNCISKIDACKENNIDLFVDDSPKHCLEVSENLGIPVIGFLSNINKEEMLKSKINFVASWDELYNIITKTINERKK